MDDQRKTDRAPSLRRRLFTANRWRLYVCCRNRGSRLAWLFANRAGRELLKALKLQKRAGTDVTEQIRSTLSRPRLRHEHIEGAPQVDVRAEDVHPSLVQGLPTSSGSPRTPSTVPYARSGQASPESSSSTDDSSRCPSCKLTPDFRDELGALVFGCCLDDWHGKHRPTAEQQAQRDREVEELMRGWRS